MTAAVTLEGALYVAQCLDVDVASQGATVDEALDNLREALELRFAGEAPPHLNAFTIAPIEVNLSRAP
jgi:predicted RNase H-like HicB family nuclease